MLLHRIHPEPARRIQDILGSRISREIFSDDPRRYPVFAYYAHEDEALFVHVENSLVGSQHGEAIDRIEAQGMSFDAVKNRLDLNAVIFYNEVPTSTSI